MSILNVPLSGNLDEHGNFHGYTILKVLPSVSCIKGSCNSDDIGQIRGTFNHGNMEGLVSVTSQLTKPDKGQLISKGNFSVFNSPPQKT